MKIPTVGTIGSIALLGGLGFIVYKFLKGDWKLPSLPRLPIPDPQTIKETGIVGGIGDIIYNLGQSGLRERVTERIYYPSNGRESAEQETKRIYGDVGITEPPDPEGLYARSVAMTVSEDVHKRGVFSFLGFPGLGIFGLPDPAVTIGAGLGAITQHGRWLETLPPEARQQAEREESEKRMEFRTTPEGIAATTIAAALFPPTAVFAAASTLIDVARISAPTPAAAPPIVKAAPTPAAAPPPVKQFAALPILEKIRVVKAKLDNVVTTSQGTSIIRQSGR